MRAAGGSGFPRRPLRRPGAPVARLAAAVTLLVVAVLGSAARGVTRLSTAGVLAAASQPVTTVVGVIVVAAACLVLAGVLVLLARRRRRRREDEFSAVSGPAGPWWARVLALRAAPALLALPVAAGSGGGRGECGVRCHGRRPGGDHRLLRRDGELAGCRRVPAPGCGYPGGAAEPCGGERGHQDAGCPAAHRAVPGGAVQPA